METPLRVVDQEHARTRSAQRSRPKRGLPTDRLKFDVQLGLLHSYGRQSGPSKRDVAVKHVAESVGISESSAGLSNRFFHEAGWLTKRGKGVYAASDDLAEYMLRRGPSGDNEKAALRFLRSPIQQSWYWRSVSPLLSNGEALKREAIIALSLEAEASAAHQPQVENVLAWLEFVGVIEIDGDLIRYAAVDGTPPIKEDLPDPPEGDGAPADKPADKPARNQVQEPTKDQGGEARPPILSFNVAVNVTADDLAKLSPEQIKELFAAVGTVHALTGRRE